MISINVFDPNFDESDEIFVLGVVLFFLQTNFGFLTSHF